MNEENTSLAKLEALTNQEIESEHPSNEPFR
ncbi:hypothetical protein PEDI_35990 [Persicobacter diffluens]|uniref:Uncharacterized protein n=1 Tax=Persicobacter diffluens TaxID=981 RepID=A0AAN4W2E6_9BACT|nr:hypothetical protein PEDI_35990 [Persicobacter diffluens]